jgi:hypothetical protein
MSKEIDKDKLIKLLAECLKWYVNEDDVIEDMVGNEYWVTGKRKAEAILALTK